MPDWKSLVRVHLKLPPLHDQRAERIVEEIAGQLDDLYQEARREGVSPRKAVRAAFAQIEDWDELSARVIEAEGPNRMSAADQRREDARDRAIARRSGLLHRLFGGIGMDVRLGLRRLGAAPTSTAIAVAVLALAIGAGTAVFSVVDAVALRGLPFDEYDRLAAVLEIDGKGRISATDDGNATEWSYLDWRRMQTAFDGLAAIQNRDLRMRNELNEPATARGLRVSSEFFAVLRVAPLIGRPFRASDEVIGQHRVAILSYALWQRQFGGAHDVVGRIMRFNDQPWQIVGVMPRHFTYPLGGVRETEVYIPLAPTNGERTRPTVRREEGGRTFFKTAGYAVIGRLRPGVSFAQAAERMNVLEAAIDAQNPGLPPGAQVQVKPLNEHLVGNVRAWMVLLLGAVGLVVALACANVANLRLAQAAIAARDIAICAALGASRWRTTRAFLVENLLLAGSSATVGILLAWGGVHVLARNLPRELPRVAAVAIDLRVLGVAVLSALVTGLLVGLAPALLHLRGRLAEATSSGGSWTTRGSGARRIGNALVVGEIALAALLLVGAGLFVASFARLMRIDPGFDYRHVLALRISTPVTRSAAPADQEAARQRGMAMIDQVRSAVRAVPRVLGAEAVNYGLPLTGVSFTGPIHIPSRGALWSEEDLADINDVTPGYLALLRVPLLRGRHFSVNDSGGPPAGYYGGQAPAGAGHADTRRVVVINQEAARRYWPGQDALGQRVTCGQPGIDECEVVGIVGNIRRQGPEVRPSPQVYFALAQSFPAMTTLAVRTAGDPMTVVHAVKKAIWSVNPEQRFDEIVTLEGFMDRFTAKRRFSMALLTLFGALGLVIAAAGVYAMLAHRVVERRREIGVRMALGATPQGVVGMVLRQALVLLGVGLAIGLGAAWEFGAGVKTFLFGTEPADPLVFAVTLIGLAVAGVLAAVGPARRASRVDPIVTLRCE